MLIDEKGIAALAKAIAQETVRAQVFGADELINEETAEWPEEYKAHVNDHALTQAQRIDAFRKNRASAIRQMEADKREADQSAENLRRSIEETDAKAARQIEQHQAQNKATLAQWEADSKSAQANGRNSPPRPQLLPETRDELAHFNYAQQHRGML